MSRTYRSNKYCAERTLVQQINRDLSRHYLYPTRSVKIRLSDEEIEAENNRRWKEYHDMVDKYAKENNLSLEQARKATVRRTYTWINLSQDTLVIPEPWPCGRHQYVRVEVTKEEVIEDTKRDYAKHKRDGHWNDTGCNKAFKQMSKRHVRTEWRNAKQQILKDEDYDYDKPYPGDYMGKKFIWSVW